MNIVINKNNSQINENWSKFRKVRAIIKKNNKYAITEEGGKIIFPGGKCDKDEDFDNAIIRELEEETGIKFEQKDLKNILTLETYYEDFYDYRISKEKPRYTITKYYYVETTFDINKDNQSLTNSEINENFNIKFVSKEELLKLLNIDHSSSTNGKFFDEENKVILENILKKY